MAFLNFPGLQYFYNKYIKPIKPHAREETIKSYTVNEQGHVPDAQLVAQLKEENESLQAEVEALNSALEARNFAGGEVAAHSYQDVTFTYTKQHDSIPVVIACLAGKADTLHRASINISVFDKTNTGFKVRIYNDSEAKVNVELSWIAMEA